MTSTDNTTPGLLYSELDDDLRATVRAAVTRAGGVTETIARIDTEESVDVALWRTLAESVGVAALPVPEDDGGAGASWRETAVVLEELGRSVTPVPMLGSAVVALRYAQVVGDGDLTARIASGETIAALAVPADTAWFSDPPEVDVVDGTLTGAVRNVVDAAAAETLIVPRGDDTYVVDVAAPGVTVSRVVSLDETRPVVDVEFRGAAGRLVSGAARRAREESLLAGTALLASEQLGLAEHCLADTVDYLGERRQFGRVLGSYQALKHRLADLWVQINQARAAARYAADAVATGSPDVAVAASTAHAWCSDVAVRAAQEYVQMHGGIGFTWEHPAHLYLKRAKASLLQFGGPDVHREVLADLVGLPRPTPVQTTAVRTTAGRTTTVRTTTGETR
ncbi:acyl-CoA dehydrogenase family protein [Gordonia shandongensis]|uniref:acyl-CoA dehydrogenase family protein n=1 Tax=Gordonia shandongensis TaxID=376351 RepID=UPI00040463A4|nr:acyl-CoA dehydrogenase family protein [Gordonia shandongensis]